MQTHPFTIAEIVSLSLTSREELKKIIRYKLNERQKLSENLGSVDDYEIWQSISQLTSEIDVIYEIESALFTISRTQ